MKKKKLSTKDGSEFTVYYLKENNEEGETTTSPAGHLGSNYIDVGDTFIEPLTEAQGELMKKNPIKDFSGWQEIESYKVKPSVSQIVSDVYQILIDDTIESDLVKDPVNGRIYKVKSLGGVVARLKEIYVGDKNLNPDTMYARMDLHGTEFVVAAEDLRKATEFEVEKYLEKSVD